MSCDNCTRLQQEVERLRDLPGKCYEDAYRDARQVLGSFTVDEATNDPFNLIDALMRMMESRMEIRRNTNTLPLLEALAADEPRHLSPGGICTVCRELECDGLHPGKGSPAADDREPMKACSCDNAHMKGPCEKHDTEFLADALEQEKP